MLAALVVVGVSGAATWKPLLVRYRLGKAQDALEMRDAESALELLKANKLLAPKDAATYFWIARSYRRLGEFDKVRENIQRAWTLGYPIEILKREEWLAMAQAGQLQEAESHLPELLKDPRDDGREICEAYVAGYLLNYSYDQALQILDAWKSDFPQDPHPYVIFGKIHEGNRNSKLAAENYRKALEIDEKQTPARIRLADLLVDLHQHEEAGKQYQRCLTETPKNPELLTSWSRWLSIMGRNDEALAALTSALETDPKFVEAQIAIGQLELAAGRPDQALKWLEPAVKLVPHDRAVRYALANSLLRAGREEESKEHFKFASDSQAAHQRVQALIEKLGRSSGDPELRFEIGSLLMKYDNPTDAATWLRGVVQIEPDHVRAHESLADHYSRHGPAELAAQHRQRAEQLKKESGN